MIKDYTVRYSNNFEIIWKNLQEVSDQLNVEKNFDALFDKNFIEFESFYIILNTFLK